MTNITKEISASDFKKYFLSLVDEVKTQNSSFVITKRKTPVAKVVPLDDNIQNKKSFFGCMKGHIKVNDDIVNVDFSDEWSNNND